MTQIAIVLAAMGGIAVIAISYFIGLAKGGQNKDDIIRETRNAVKGIYNMHQINKVAICTRNCKDRRMVEKLLGDKLIEIGKKAYNNEPDDILKHDGEVNLCDTCQHKDNCPAESKIIITGNCAYYEIVDTGARPSICAVCVHEEPCPNVDMTKSECNGFIHVKDAYPEELISKCHACHAASFCEHRAGNVGVCPNFVPKDKPKVAEEFLGCDLCALNPTCDTAGSTVEDCNIFRRATPEEQVSHENKKAAVSVKFDGDVPSLFKGDEIN